MSAGRQLPLLPAESDWRLLDERERGTVFIGIRSRSLINSADTTRMSFWSVNPYIGCEFGCTYCYARDTHRFAVERESGKAEGAPSESPLSRAAALPPRLAFERRILVKEDAAQQIARSFDPARLGGATLMIGTATDPYQPAERKFRITRGILEALARHRGAVIGIITKSPLVVRDVDVLRILGTRGDLHVNISLVTTDAPLARSLEARSPVPSARLKALARLRAAGIDAGLLIAPIIPGVTDGRAALARLFAAARDAGAQFVRTGALRLGPSARAGFLPHLQRAYPGLVARYRRQYGGGTQASEAYRAALTARLDALRRDYGFAPSTEREM